MWGAALACVGSWLSQGVTHGQAFAGPHRGVIGSDIAWPPLWWPVSSVLEVSSGLTD